jgi:hypothetical protein
MKVTRLKKGYRIAMTDAEFALIRGLVSDGANTYQGDETAYNDYLTPQDKRTWTRLENTRGGLMVIDEDQRGGEA